MGWNIVPDGLREMLLWIQNRHDNPLLFITENGSSFHEPQDVSAVNDIKRQSFIKNHLLAASEAIQSKDIRLSGYFVWSLMDNFEWQFGYQRRFGIIRVDYDTLARIPKGSAMLYRDIIRFNQQGGKIP